MFVCLFDCPWADRSSWVEPVLIKCLAQGHSSDSDVSEIQTSNLLTLPTLYNLSTQSIKRFKSFLRGDSASFSKETYSNL